jgi:hypothetical protein
MRCYSVLSTSNTCSFEAIDSAAALFGEADLKDSVCNASSVSSSSSSSSSSSGEKHREGASDSAALGGSATVLECEDSGTQQTQVVGAGVTDGATLL